MFIRKISGIAVLMLISYLVDSQSKSLLDCKIALTNDTLRIENSLISQKFLWNNGLIIPIEILRKDLNTILKFPNDRIPDVQIFLPGIKASNGYIEIRENQYSVLDARYLQAEITFSLGELNVKRIIEIFPQTAAISHTFFLKGKLNLSGTESAESNRLTMIESEKLPDNVLTRIGKISLNNPHWKFIITEFKEATDYNNTLVRPYSTIAYNKAQKVSGNIVLATNDFNNSGFYIKESPLGESQQSYSGADFEISQSEFSILGVGMSPGQVNVDLWTRGYGYVLGLGNADPETLLIDLKKHQKNKRTQLPERDEMILANTWGDRSRDSRMNEAFILHEIEACAKLGITHLQLDDGWQQGLSKNSASKSGVQWDDWSAEDWKPHQQRFPNGLEKIIEYANKNKIEICLWFNPSKSNHYSNWKRDADILIDFYKTMGIKVFKIDGIELEHKAAEINLRQLFDRVKTETNGEVVFNLDVTAGHRTGYFYFLEFGNLYLENRYTDWANYYPYRTLRNLWMLSKYIPSEKIQVEFLNKWRNSEKYLPADPLAPFQIPFSYQVASTFAGQPLAWMEVSQLPGEAYEISELLNAYKKVQFDFHSGIIIPVGSEPNGMNWSGFQSLDSENGFFLIFRAYTTESTAWIKTQLPSNHKIKLEHLFGNGISIETESNDHGELLFSLPSQHSFAMYKYTILN